MEAKPTKVETWKLIISCMTMEDIERRSLLVSMSPSTEDNIKFQELLTQEYNKRKQQ